MHQKPGKGCLRPTKVAGLQRLDADDENVTSKRLLNKAKPRIESDELGREPAFQGQMQIT